jgi:Protein of unknown function (DUF1559)
METNPDAPAATDATSAAMVEMLPENNKVYRGARIAAAMIVTCVLLVLLLVPATRSAPEAGKRTQCKNNLKQIGLAFHNYHDRYGSFPPAYTVDAEGNRLHSWRTLILPYLDQQLPYESIDISKPWDDPVNAKARLTELGCYRSPTVAKDIQPNQTTYLAVSSPESCFPGSEPRCIADIKDGPENTIIVLDAVAANAVEWMAPHDMGGLTSRRQLVDEKAHHTGIIQVLMGDGTVRAISTNTNATTIEGLLTITGGETIGEF